MTPSAGLLRPWSVQDADWYVAQLNDPLIRRFTVESPETTAADAVEALSRLEGRSDQIGYAIVDEAGALAGNIAAHRSGRTADVSYWLAATHRGRGPARRAVEELLARLADDWTDLTRVELGCTATTPPPPR